MYERDGIQYPTYGAYLRGKSLRVDTGRDARNAWDHEIDSYKDARRQGIQPAGTRQPQIDAAVQLSEMAGKAFDASNGSFN